MDETGKRCDVLIVDRNGSTTDIVIYANDTLALDIVQETPGIMSVEWSGKEKSYAEISPRYDKKTLLNNLGGRLSDGGFSVIIRSSAYDEQANKIAMSPAKSWDGREARCE